ncbi:MAG: GNAT family N-acetyltransferase [Actinomycetota bacterium]|nr:GNAT family N-acetyltransferase [Actinomycetota bacterium]
MSLSPPVLETERLWLRHLSLGDLDDLAAILTDPETMQYYRRPFTREEAREWILQNLHRYETDGFGLWAVVSKETGEFLGDCGPVRRFVDDRDEVEIGWQVKRNHWRQGIASEAGAGSRDYSFGTLGLTRVISLIRPENIPSRGVAEKIGMAIEKEIDYKGMAHYVYVLERPSSGTGSGSR